MTSTTSMTTKRTNTWIAFVKQYRAEHEGMTWKDALKAASEPYKQWKSGRSSAPAEVATSRIIAEHVALPAPVSQAKARTKTITVSITKLPEPVPSGSLIIPSSTKIQPPQSPAPYTPAPWRKPPLPYSPLPRLVAVGVS